MSKQVSVEVLAIAKKTVMLKAKAAKVRDEIRAVRMELCEIEDSLDVSVEELNDASNALEKAADDISQWV